MEQNEKRGSTSLALKAGFWYVFSTFIVKSLSFITTPIFSRLMSKTDYGEFSNFASWQVLLLIVVGAELYNTIPRAYYDYTEDFDKYVSSVTIASCLLSATLYIIALLCGEWTYKIISIPKEFIHILFFMLTFQACKQLFLAKERTLYRYKTVAKLSVINLLVPTLIAVVMVILADSSNKLAARIYGFYVPSALIGLICGIVLLKKGKYFSLKHCKYAFALSIPLVVHYLSAHLLTSSNTIVTKNVLGAQAVSTVSMASSANHILTILLQAISGAITTWLMDNLQQENVKNTRKGILFYVGGISLIAFGVILLAPEIIWILGGAKYADSVILMPGMVVAVLIQSTTTVFTIMLTYQKSVVKTALYTTLVSIVCILAKFFLLPVFGVMALPYINIGCFGILFVINYFLVKKSGLGKYVNLKGLLAIIGILLGCMFASYLLYQNIILRYGLILVLGIAFLIVLYKYRDTVMKLVKSKLKKKKNK